MSAALGLFASTALLGFGGVSAAWPIKTTDLSNDGANCESRRGRDPTFWFYCRGLALVLSCDEATATDGLYWHVKALRQKL